MSTEDVLKKLKKALAEKKAKQPQGKSSTNPGGEKQIRVTKPMDIASTRVNRSQP
jgi:hypothetical protein